MKNPGVVILAAGSSKRMGSHKLFLPFEEEITFLEHLLKVYLEFGCLHSVLVVNKKINEILMDNSKLKTGIQIIENPFPELGRFYSIQLGLKCFSERKNVFIQNIDNPFVNLKLLQKLNEGLLDYDCAVPVYMANPGHPVLLSELLVADLKNEPSHQMNFRYFLRKYKIHKIPVDDPLIMANINTPEDYRKYFTLR